MSLSIEQRCHTEHELFGMPIRIALPQRRHLVIIT